MNNKWITYTIKADLEGMTVEEILKGPLQLSGRMINRLTRRKGILLNGRSPWMKQKVKTGDQIKAAVRPLEKSDLQPEPVPFTIVYEDLDLMVIDKPAGVTVHPVRPDDRSTLVHGILHVWEQQGFSGVPRPVHRLDRNTSGLILIAKNAYMHQLLDRQLRQKKIERRYLALLGRPLPRLAGTIDAPIGRDPGHPTRRKIKKGGEHAVTHYQVRDQNEQGALVEVRLETGRTHQIRVHFAHLQAPLMGDSLYQGELSLIKRQALHSSVLSFLHPLQGKEMRFTSPLPDDMKQAADRLRLCCHTDP
ncbi:RluA family pseudouridine synthase [Thermoactinomyces sp. CICC 10522]|nr:RluA family pseudouridine synthase [Thermoactinomyces sp. CICC 10522]